MLKYHSKSQCWEEGILKRQSKLHLQKHFRLQSLVFIMVLFLSPVRM